MSGLFASLAFRTRVPLAPLCGYPNNKKRKGEIEMNQKNMERDLLQQELASNESKLAQLKHQQERLENRITYYEKGERKKRTHRLCTIAGTLESIAPGIKELTLPEVIELLEIIFNKSDVKSMVHNWVLLHRQTYGEVESGGIVPLECDAD
jgi:hypothetical protein